MTWQVNPHPWHLLCGLTVWAAFFVVIYGGAAVGCAVAPPQPESGAFTWINGAVLGITLLTTLLLLALGRACYKRTPTRPNEGRFLLRLAAALYALSALATLVVGLPAAIYPPCV